MKLVLYLVPFIIFAALLLFTSALAKAEVSPYTMGILFNTGLILILLYSRRKCNTCKV